MEKQINRRSFIKRAGLLSGLAVLNPLRFLGLFKPKPALGMETMKAAYSVVYDAENHTLHLKLHRQWAINLSYYNGKQWIPMED